MRKQDQSETSISLFGKYLEQEEKSRNTIEKYLRDVHGFMRYCRGSEFNKDTVIAYKKFLIDKNYAVRSINSMLASLNSYFTFIERLDCKVKSLKLQKEIYRAEVKELTRSEYERLCSAAENRGNKRLSLMIQTICGTGIRVSELEYISIEAVKKGEAVVSCKGKVRTVFIVKKLRKKLLQYAAAKGIRTGSIFVTRTGEVLNRTNIWREMKQLCAEAKVDPQKVYPHNLRHLFAREFYRKDRDIARLADILGHSNINTTRIYIISTGNEHRKRMESMHLII